MPDLFDSMLTLPLTLAQDVPAVTQPATTGGPGTGTPPPGWFTNLGSFVPLILLGVLFYLLMVAPQRRKQKEAQKMLSAIEKGDRVVTIGGVLGTVVSVGDGEVTLKVDETSNTKIRFQKSAIATVEPRATPGDNAEAKK